MNVCMYILRWNKCFCQSRAYRVCVCVCVCVFVCVCGFFILGGSIIYRNTWSPYTYPFQFNKLQMCVWPRMLLHSLFYQQTPNCSSFSRIPRMLDRLTMFSHTEIANGAAWKHSSKTQHEKTAQRLWEWWKKRKCFFFYIKLYCNRLLTLIIRLQNK